MSDQIVREFLQSAAGQDAARQLRQHGLDDAQTRAAIAATVEGARHHVQRGGGMESEASGLANGAQAASGIAAQVAQFVSQRAGLQPEVAQQVVSVSLPKLLELLQGSALPSPRPSRSDPLHSRH